MEKRIRIPPSPEVIKYRIDKKKTMKMMLSFYKDKAYSIRYIDNCYGLKNDEMILDFHCISTSAEQLASSLELCKILSPLKINFIGFEQTTYNKYSYHFKFKLETYEK